jgi:alpha-soluble NSF attachment protein
MGDESTERGREGKGNDLMQQAEKKLKSFSIFGAAGKTEAAMELYDKAAAQFKMTKQWDDAGDAYIKMAECAEKISNQLEAVNAYTNAAKAYKNGNTKEAIKTFRIAAEMRMENNQFQQAAKLYQEIGAIEEKNMNMKGAIKAYSDAADCFQSEGSGPSENQALLKVAELSASEEDYARAISIYEKVSATALESTLLKYSVKDYFFKAALCQFVLCAKAQDMKVLEDKLERYKDQHPAFDGDRSSKLIEACAKAFEDDDVDAFTDHVFAYDKIYKLDNWTASLLLIVKKILKDGGVMRPGIDEPDEPDLS